MALRFKLDENIPGEAAALFRAGGHDVSTALEQKLGGTDDPRLLAACGNENRVLVTFDLDFGDIRAYPPSSHSGAWVLRPAIQSIDLLLEMLRRSIVLAEREPVRKRLWLVEPGRVRIRD